MLRPPTPAALGLQLAVRQAPVKGRALVRSPEGAQPPMAGFKGRRPLAFVAGSHCYRKKTFFPQGNGFRATGDSAVTDQVTSIQSIILQ